MIRNLSLKYPKRPAFQDEPEKNFEGLTATTKICRWEHVFIPNSLIKNGAVCFYKGFILKNQVCNF